MAEATNDDIIMLFLDWEKAFDRLNPKAIMQTQRRMEAPEKRSNILKSFTTNKCSESRVMPKDQIGMNNKWALDRGVRSPPSYSFLQ